LIEEHAAEGLSYSTVRDYVRVRRAQIDLKGGLRVQAFIAKSTPLVRRPRSTSARSGW